MSGEREIKQAILQCYFIYLQLRISEFLSKLHDMNLYINVSSLSRIINIRNRYPLFRSFDL